MSTAEVTSSTAGSTASAGLTVAAKERGTSRAATLAGPQETVGILAAVGAPATAASQAISPIRTYPILSLKR